MENGLRSIEIKIARTGRWIVEVFDGAEQSHLVFFACHFLWSYAQLVRQWSMRTRAELERWKDSSPAGKTERGLEIIAHVMQIQPFR